MAELSAWLAEYGEIFLREEVGAFEAADEIRHRLAPRFAEVVREAVAFSTAHDDVAAAVVDGWIVSGGNDATPGVLDVEQPFRARHLRYGEVSAPSVLVLVDRMRAASAAQVPAADPYRPEPSPTEHAVEVAERLASRSFTDLSEDEEEEVERLLGGVGFVLGLENRLARGWTIHFDLDAWHAVRAGLGDHVPRYREGWPSLAEALAYAGTADGMR